MKRDKYGINTDLHHDYTWAKEDWLFIALMFLLALWAFVGGLLIGILWASFI